MRLRLAFAPGVMPAKWLRIWDERFPDDPAHAHPLASYLDATAEAERMLAADELDVALVRLPLSAGAASQLHAIPLYTEEPVVVLPKEHEATLLETVSFGAFEELARVDRENGAPGLGMLEPGDDVAAAVELVAAGVGYLVLPKAVARAFSRRDVVARALDEADAEPWRRRVALVWRRGLGEDRAAMVDDFVGVVRGRTTNSTRGAETTAAIAAASAQKPTAAAKARAAEARAAAAAGGGGSKKQKASGGGSPSSKKRPRPPAARGRGRGRGR
ncbi:LysR family transcriptional regulator substrate-binding protein [Herbiconiux moechotypicola]|uniref:LysR substrate-binding domain-containing protein n=1 Tax=Herbiconiux moechotypicola TaxID=637393 RepID=A0ABP5QAR2_9MICO|nr:LysR family transcriptional regulator substrate-binding protein [Herbiconiux moechotypicola]MCS5728700.1 LysR family transcriptional regulator substrate-binding protein [Herbiconiux moechotypicola]